MRIQIPYWLMLIVPYNLQLNFYEGNTHTHSICFYVKNNSIHVLPTRQHILLVLLIAEGGYFCVFFNILI